MITSTWRKRANRQFWKIVLSVVVAALLYFAFRQAPIRQIIVVLGQLQVVQVSILILLNLVFLLLVNFRWWLLLRSLGWIVPLRALVRYRLAGFSISYITPAPQFGGEPLQVFLLRNKEGVSLEDATSSVFLDRLVDLLANFTFLFAASLAMLASGTFNDWLPAGSWIIALVLLMLPAGHLFALSRKVFPATWLVQRLRWPAVRRIHDLVLQTEVQVAQIIRERPIILGKMVMISAMAWVVSITEFWLLLSFLGNDASWIEAIAALTLLRLAFLAPIPGGLGALEASLVFAAQMAGWGAAAGIAASLVIRARDMFLALLGLGGSTLGFLKVSYSEQTINERR